MEHINISHFIQKELVESSDIHFQNDDGASMTTTEAESYIDFIRDNEVLLMIGDTDQRNKKTFLFSLTSNSIHIVKRHEETKELDHYSYFFNTKELKKNNLVLHNDSSFIIRFIREFKARNASIKCYKSTIKRGLNNDFSRQH